MKSYACRILANVPRLAEHEPGYAVSMLLKASDHLDISTAPATGAPADTLPEPTAYYEPISRRWMGAPKPRLAHQGGGSWSLTGSSAPLTEVSPSGLQGLGAAEDLLGVAITAEAESIDAPWRLETVAPLLPMQGLVLALYCYEPVSWEWATAPLRVIIADRWKLELLSAETGLASALLYERELAEDAPWSDVPTLCTAIEGPLFNHLHRLWLQPLDADEWLLRSWDRPELGQVIRSRYPVEYVPPAPDDLPPDSPPPTAVTVPWGSSPLAIEGVTRGFVVTHEVIMPASWRIGSPAPVELGYLTEELPVIDAHAYVPGPSLASVPGEEPDDPRESSYTMTPAVTTPAGDPFGSTAADRYQWSVTVTGPADVTVGDRQFSRLPVTLDRLAIRWPLTLVEGSVVPVDLTASATIGVSDVSEDLTADDSAARFMLAVDGPKAELEPLIRPNARWQLLIREVVSPGVYGEEIVRFDGLLDSCQRSIYQALDGSYYLRASLSFRNRWRQVDSSLYRGSVPLDGMTRSEVYQLLAEQVPLDPATEISIASDLQRDAVLPTARSGEPAAFLPRIGTDLGAVIRDLQKGFGATDRVRFIGTVFTVDTRDTTSIRAGFYRHPDAAAAPVVADVPNLLVAAPDLMQAFAAQIDDLTFINDLWVIGRDGASPPENPRPLVAYLMDPASWQDDSDYEPYVGQRRTAVVVRPELRSQAAVDAWCRSLWAQFHRFTYTAVLQSWWEPTLRPGDLVVIHAGQDPGASTLLVEVTGMRTRQVAAWGAPWDVQFATAYEVRLINEDWMPE